MTTSPSAPFFFIGSLPFNHVGPALDFVSRYSSHLPFVPQLPALSPQEDMIGQVLRGFEIGGWDDRASICFAPFLYRFIASARAKFQLAGPSTVARVMSRPLEEVSAQWLGLAKQLLGQWQKAGFRGEIWLQVDEPFWSQTRPLPYGYENILNEIRAFYPNLRLGLHSCGLPRPMPSPALAHALDFLSLDFSEPPTAEEKIQFEEIFGRDKTLVAGILNRGKNISSLCLEIPNGQLWRSATCGLYDWSIEDLGRVFGKS